MKAIGWISFWIVILIVNTAVTQENLAERYGRGIELFQTRQYAQAESLFQVLQNEQITGDLVDNVDFWLGEALFARHQFKDALREFDRVFTYNNANKRPDALMKIGLCYWELGKKELACKTWNSYPEIYTSGQETNKRDRILNRYCR